MDAAFDAAPERREFDLRRMPGQNAAQDEIGLLDASLGRAANRAALQMDADALAFAAVQLAVEPSAQVLLNPRTVVHKNDLSLSCNFFRA
jgi:hypothetical protein